MNQGARRQKRVSGNSLVLARPHQEIESSFQPDQALRHVFYFLLLRFDDLSLAHDFVLQFDHGS